MIPAIITGFVFESQIEKLFELDSLVFIGFMLIITGILLLLADKAKKSEKSLNIKKSLIIGIGSLIFTPFTFFTFSIGLPSNNYVI